MAYWVLQEWDPQVVSCVQAILSQGVCYDKLFEAGVFEIISIGGFQQVHADGVQQFW